MVGKVTEQTVAAPNHQQVQTLGKGMGEKSNFQSYHMIILKMLSTKNYKACKEMGKYGPSLINSFICLFTKLLAHNLLITTPLLTHQ